jgi:hypothetical protein
VLQLASETGRNPLLVARLKNWVASSFWAQPWRIRRSLDLVAL